MRLFGESRPAETCHQVNSESQQRSPKKLNDHIYELYEPKGQPTIEIIFFHGLQFEHDADTYLSTWRTGDNTQQIWPGTWLAEKFPDAHIFTVKYDSSMEITPDQGRFDMFNVAENLLHAICLGKIGQGLHRPVILVGHSFGGLVMKQLCVEAHDTQSRGQDMEKNQMIANFLRNVEGLFFYGTPHRGIRLEEIGAEVHDGPLLDYVELLSKQAARLDTAFDSVMKKYKIWRIAGVGESNETLLGRNHCLVVPEGSARYGTDFCTVTADHISLCKPAEKTSMIFLRLVDFISASKVQGGGGFENIQPLPKVAIGLDLEVEKIRKMLQGSATVGITGMGGIGKTTLARALFNKLCPTFEYSCFLFEVKLITGCGEDVKKEIWKNTYYRGRKVAGNEDDWSQLRRQQLLLVLDDVAYNKDTGFRDLDVLSDIVRMVDLESRFIATSRDQELLRRLENVKLHKVPFLSEENAQQLFLGYALPEKVLPPGLSESLVMAVAKKCDGLPLTLEIIGKYLHLKLKEENVEKFFQDTLEALDKAESIAADDEQLWAKLMISYDGLKEKEQQMFLDAATFFNDDSSFKFSTMPLYVAKAAWSVSYGYEDTLWANLVNASLVYDVNEDEPIKVHEQLLCLGRKIAASYAGKVGKCRRVWKAKEGFELLQSRKSNDQEILTLRARDWDDVNISRSFLCRLKKLQYLDADDRYYYAGNFGIRKRLKYLFFKLRKSFPETLQTALVLLQCTSLHCGPVPFDIGRLPRLAVLTLRCYDRRSLPRSFTQLAELKILDIYKASLLLTLPNDIGCLSKLERLELRYCFRLRALPETFGNLRKLKHLYLSGCHDLLSLPENLGSLSELKSFKLEKCLKLLSLPESFGQLASLNDLLLWGIPHLETLPETFCNLPKLKNLELCRFGKEFALPDSFGNLSALNRLEMVSLQFNSLPASFGDLPALEYLRLDIHRGILTLPDSFGNLSALNHLDLSCDNLYTLPASFGKLSALNYLRLSCRNLRTLPDSFGNLTALNRLEMSFLQFNSLPASFGDLPALEYLLLEICRRILTLPDSFGNLSALKHLDVEGCDNLGILPESFGNLPALNHLNLSCDNLNTLPHSFGNLSTLNQLELSCANLYTLPDSFGKLSALNNLRLRCHNLRILPDSFGNLTALNHLFLEDCDNLDVLPDSFGNLSALNQLNLSCANLYTLPESFGKLSALNSLRLECGNLCTLPDSFGNLSALNHLKLISCDNLRTLPNSARNLFALKDLTLWRCAKLDKSFNQLTHLNYLLHEDYV